MRKPSTTVWPSSMISGLSCCRAMILPRMVLEKIPISMPVKIMPVRPRIVYRMIYSSEPESEDGKEEDMAERRLSQKTAMTLLPSLWRWNSNTRTVTNITEVRTMVSSSLTMLAVPSAMR